jgi:hypothetical protein
MRICRSAVGLHVRFNSRVSSTSIDASTFKFQFPCFNTIVRFQFPCFKYIYRCKVLYPDCTDVNIHGSDLSAISKPAHGAIISRGVLVMRPRSFLPLRAPVLSLSHKL